MKKFQLSGLHWALLILPLFSTITQKQRGRLWLFPFLIWLETELMSLESWNPPTLKLPRSLCALSAHVSEFSVFIKISSFSPTSKYTKDLTLSHIVYLHSKTSCDVLPQAYWLYWYCAPGDRHQHQSSALFCKKKRVKVFVNGNDSPKSHKAILI